MSPSAKSFENPEEDFKLTQKTFINEIKYF
jgi:hypothetical protein